MTLEEKKEIVVAVYRKALGAGLCRTVKEFAELLAMHTGAKVIDGIGVVFSDKIAKKTESIK